jgi:hypothetical protein
VGALLAVSGCARLHHYQLGEIDSSRGRLEPFVVQVNETGLNVHDGAAIAKGFAQTKEAKEQADTLETLIALTQYGPKTGDPTFSKKWADNVLASILERCPSGRVTGLRALRESMDYPVISGEIVTIKGYCVQ